MTVTVLILNGPNLNLLGRRQPEIYGQGSLADIEAACRLRATELGVAIDFRQTNHEGELITWIQESPGDHNGIMINPGALSHTSVALLDALLACDLPVVEVHLSNIHQREAFRHHSYTSQAAAGVICGFGAQGYQMALEGIVPLMEADK